MTHYEYKLLIEVFQSNIDRHRTTAMHFAYDHVATGDEGYKDLAKNHMDHETYWRSAMKVVEEFQAEQLHGEESQP